LVRKKEMAGAALFESCCAKNPATFWVPEDVAANLIKNEPRMMAFRK
jgi:hypothetical protein